MGTFDLTAFLPTIPSTPPPGTPVRLIEVDPCQSHLVNAIGTFNSFMVGQDWSSADDRHIVYGYAIFDGHQYAGGAYNLEFLIGDEWIAFKDLPPSPLAAQ
jgi:hypothetical protein